MLDSLCFRTLRLGLCVSVFVLAVLAPIARSTAADKADALHNIRERGHLICGTAQSETGFSAVSQDQVWSGIYVDLCRALASAVTGSADAVRFRPLKGAERFAAVRGGDVDLLSRGTAWTLMRDAGEGVSFVAPYFHDGTGFLIRRETQIASALELSGATICFVSGSLAETGIVSYFQRRGMKFMARTADTWALAVAQFKAGQCSVLAADQGRLAVVRMAFDQPEAYVLLPELASNDVFGPLVRSEDAKWFKIVRWLVFSLIRAEELDLGRRSIGNAARSDDPAVRSFLKVAADGGAALGLGRDWLVRTIAAVGNYAEIFDRNLGKAAGVNLERGRNAPVGNGGALYSPAFR